MVDPIAYPLWPRQDEPATPKLTFRPFLHDDGDDRPRPVILCFPGGGYGALAVNKVRRVADRLGVHGYHTAVLRYRLGSDGHRHPAMIHDAKRAIRLLRHHAEELKIEPDRVAVLGKSAGGHLAASLAVFADDASLDPPADDLAHVSARPDALVLCYPVIDMHDPHAHAGSRKNLLPDPDDTAQRDLLSVHRHVREGHPPTFLFQTAGDRGVVMHNALGYASAVNLAGSPVELHVFEEGGHGVALALDHPPADRWPEFATAFLARHL